jgi:hypothetical protein
MAGGFIGFIGYFIGFIVFIVCKKWLIMSILSNISII